MIVSKMVFHHFKVHELWFMMAKCERINNHRFMVNLVNNEQILGPQWLRTSEPQLMGSSWQLDGWVISANDSVGQ